MRGSALEAIHACLRKIRSINVITMCEPTKLQKLGTSWSVRQTGWPLSLVGEHDFYETSVLISDRTLRPCSACQSAYADCMLVHQSALSAGFFDIASSRILSVDVPGNTKLSVYYQVNSAADATKFQTYKGPMTLLQHQEFRFYEQEPAGVRITVGLRERGGQPIASGEDVVQGDEAGLLIAVHLQDSTGREIAQIVFLLSCAPGKESVAAHVA